MDNKNNLLLQLNNLEQNQQDFTLMNVKFIIMDEYLSGNGQIVEKEVLIPALSTLKNKPIVAKYYKVSEVGANDDALGDHEEHLDIDKNGNKFINTDTTPIGHFTTEGYFEEYNGKEVVMCDGVIYADRNRDLVSLLKEWYDNGIQINSSVEYYYKNYEVKDGIEYVKLPLLFSGHCLLNSEDRGESKVVDGAYSDSQLLSINQKIAWNKAVAQINEIEEGEVMFFKKVNELSHGDIRSKIYEQLAKIMSADEYNRIWISSYGVYDAYFIYEVWVDDGYEYYKVEYSKNESDELVISLDSKVKVEKVSDWKEVKNQIQTLSEKVEGLEVELSTKQETITSLNSEKKTLSTELNTATEKLTSLNSKVEELSEIEQKYNEEKFEQALNERKSEFETKFKSVNAMDKFNSKEVQEMIKNSIDDNSMLNSLNAMIVELIPTITEDKKDDDKFIKDLNNKKVGNLIPKDNSFESRYMEK